MVSIKVFVADFYGHTCHHHGRPSCLLPSREVAGFRGGGVVAIVMGET